MLEDVPHRVRAERVVERHGRAAEAVHGLLGQDPLGAVPHVDPQEEQPVAVAVEEALAAGLEARSDRLDAGDALAVARVDVRRGESAVAAEGGRREIQDTAGVIIFVATFSACDVRLPSRDSESSTTRVSQECSSPSGAVAQARPQRIDVPAPSERLVQRPDAIAPERGRR